MELMPEIGWIDKDVGLFVHKEMDRRRL
jgi:hypothetical protein